MRLLEPPRPWHVVLAPALPLLGLFGTNTAVSSPVLLLWPTILAIAFAAVVLMALLAVARDPHRAALATSVLVLAMMSYGTLNGLSGSAGGWLIPAVYVAVLAVCAKFVRTLTPGAPATVLVNRAFGLAAVFLLVPIGLSAAARSDRDVKPFRIDATADVVRPDVYVLVLDGYAREDVLREQYGFANDLVPDLRRLGFSVAGHAMANYAQTSLSLSSALNAEYLPDLGFRANPDTAARHGVAGLIRRNRFFKAFKDAGYYIRAYGSEYAMVRPEPADERPAPFGMLDEFEYAAMEATVFPAAARSLGLDRGGLAGMLHRRHLEWTLRDLASFTPDGSRPALVFAHLIAPHPPFVFDAGGGPRRSRVPTLLHDGSHWDDVARPTNESYAAGYVDKVRFLNERVVRSLTKVLQRSHRPAIVLVHSDHGPGDRLDWNDAVPTDMRERMGILLAVRFPEAGSEPIGASATPINAYRAVLNRALGAALPALEDRSFFSTWTNPFAYIEVTDRVNCADCG